MHFQEVSTINLNGRFYDRESLLNLSTTKLNDPRLKPWQQEVYTFLTQWLNDDDHVWVKTSGSTGKPKNIRIGKQSMVASALKTGQFLKLREGDRALLCLPAKYIAGKMMLVRAMALGLDLTTVEPASNPLKNLTALFDFAAMVPLQVHEVLEEKGGFQKLNTIKNLIIGGGPVSETLRKKIRLLTNRSFSTYGMTETVTHIAMERLNGPNADGWFSALPNVAVRLDNENRLMIDAPGILAQTISTNDLAELKNKNRFRIIGRYDNIINSGGIKIIPEDIEKKIERLINGRFIISSIPDERLGEMPVLVLEGKPADGKKILHEVATQLDKYQKPKQIFYLQSFPEAGNQKINRRKIREIILKICN